MREPLSGWSTAAPEQMEELGAQLGASFTGGRSGPVIVHLVGDLGAGKTTFARGFIRGAGFRDTVRSPTYSLLESYSSPRLGVLHLDLYRLRDPSELELLGLRDWASPEHVWLVEWPDKGGSSLSAADLRLRFLIADGAHTVGVEEATGLGREWLARATTA